MRQPRRFVIIIPVLICTMAPFAASAQGAIEGTVTFWGDAGGGTQIEVGAHLDLYGPPEESVFVSVPGGAYSFPVADGTYYMIAFMSRDGYVGEPRDEDLVVWYDADADGDPDQVTVSGGSVTGIDIDLGFVYVDIDATGGANNGSSWADAFTGLQDGIDLAVSGIEVWVAEGTYLPGASRSDSFLPKPGVRVCGGFTGVEAVRQERDWNNHPTILSGDIGATGTNTDNSYHVVRAEGSNPNALLDGVTITGGYSNGGAGDDQGGGVRARGGGVTLANVILIDNYASSSGGGVMVNNWGTVKAYNSSFINNQCAGGHGGGYYASAASTEPQTLVNCVFTGNYAWRGGGISIESVGPTPVLVNLSLSGNSAGGEGGGIFTYSTQSFLIQNSVFWGNTGTNPQISFWTTTPTVSYSIVQGGWATGSNILTDEPSFSDTALRLNLDSPAIDAGDNTATPLDVHDVDGNHVADSAVGVDRDFNRRDMNIPYIPDTGNSSPGSSTIDMGAYEAYDPALIFWDDFDDGDANEWSNIVGEP